MKINRKRYYSLSNHCQHGQVLMRGLAHWIRNPSSKQFKAAESLQAERRWCLTGTPIQNSLDDLRSLLRYLHLQPFASQSFFEKHIVDHLRSDSHDSFRNLKLLLRIVCLRRKAACLCLPPAETEMVAVTLTPQEAAVYNGILADCKAEYDRIVSTKSVIKKFSVLFTTIMRLRRLCNHGTLHTDTLSFHAPSGEGQKSRRRQVYGDGEISCEFCSGEDEDTVMLLNGLEMCPECSRPLASQEDSLSQPSMDELSPSSLALPTSASPGSTQQYDLSTSLDSPFGFKECYSSKLVAVTENIQRRLDDSKR